MENAWSRQIIPTKKTIKTTVPKALLLNVLNQ